MNTPGRGRKDIGKAANIQDTRLLTFNAVLSHCAPTANYINTGGSANGPQPISTDVARLPASSSILSGPSDAYPSREKQRQNPAPGFKAKDAEAPQAHARQLSFDTSASKTLGFLRATFTNLMSAFGPPSFVAYATRRRTHFEPVLDPHLGPDGLSD
ncbi:hypothetical protein CGRA01v4_05167 [Colletotrichum graminicola]|nr:hypothetical protein CGRA01v4_05167 [Colletotrichum graminicola]